MIVLHLNSNLIVGFGSHFIISTSPRESSLRAAFFIAES